MLLLDQVSWSNIVHPLPKNALSNLTVTNSGFHVSAIDVPKEGENVTQESIDMYHGIFLKELEALFERHKHEAGYGKRQLKII